MNLHVLRHLSLQSILGECGAQAGSCAVQRSRNRGCIPCLPHCRWHRGCMCLCHSYSHSFTTGIPFGESWEADHPLRRLLVQQHSWRDGLQVECMMVLNGEFQKRPPQVPCIGGTAADDAEWRHFLTSEGFCTEQMTSVQGEGLLLRVRSSFLAANEPTNGLYSLPGARWGGEKPDLPFL